MSTQLKLRRGTTAQHSTFTGASGEVTVDTTKNTLVVHDGTTAGGNPLIREHSKNSLYLDNGNINAVPADGYINIAGGQLKLFADGDGDGDYDYDVLSLNNLYLAGTSSIHLRTQPNTSEELRVKFVGTASTNFIQSGKDYAGTTLKHLAFSAYNSTNYWGIFNKDSGYFGIGNISVPLAPLHTYNTATTGAVIENTASAGSRVGFKGSLTSSATTVTVGCDGDDLAIRAGSAEQVRVKAGGNFQMNSGYGSVATAYGCRAWVNFNGTGTVAIRASGNVSSITDLGTGIYQINLSTSMPDANYSVCGLVGDANRAASNGINVAYFGITSRNSSNTLTDSDTVTAAAFR